MAHKDLHPTPTPLSFIFSTELAPSPDSVAVHQEATLSVFYFDPLNPSVIWDKLNEPMPDWVAIRFFSDSGFSLADCLIREDFQLEALRNPALKPKALRNSKQYKQTDWASDNCPICSSPLFNNATGRPPVYCSDACKMRAYRSRSSRQKMPAGLGRSA